MRRLGIVEQAAIGGRLEHVCRESFGGDVAKLAMILGLKSATVKQIVAGKVISRDHFDLFLTRVARLQEVCNVEWIRSGQGEPYGGDGRARRLVLGLDDAANGVMHLDARIVPKPSANGNGVAKHEQAATATNGAPKLGENGNTVVALLTRLSERLDRFEKRFDEIAHEARAIARKEVKEAGDSWERGIQERASADVKDAMDRLDRQANMIQHVEGIATSARSEASKAAARAEAAAGTADRCEACVSTLHREYHVTKGDVARIAGRLDALVQEVDLLAEAVTSPTGDAVPTPPAMRRESDLGDAEYLSISDYIACEWDAERVAIRDTLHKAWLIQKSKLQKYLSDASVVLRMPCRVRREGILGSEHAVAVLRVVAEFLGPDNATEQGKHRRRNFLEIVMASREAMAVAAAE